MCGIVEDVEEEGLEILRMSSDVERATKPHFGFVFQNPKNKNLEHEDFIDRHF